MSGVKPTPDQMRAMGYAAGADPVYLSDAAWVAFCAWYSPHPAQVPENMRWTVRECAEAWERVAVRMAMLFCPTR
jgi:hypothetical protein